MALLDNLVSFFVGTHKEREARELRELYDRVKAAFDRSPYADSEDILLEFVHDLVKEVEARLGFRLAKGFDLEVMDCVYSLTQQDPVLFWWCNDLPDTPPADIAVAYLKFLRVKERVLSNPKHYEDIWREKVIRILEGILGYLRPALEPLSPLLSDDEPFPLTTRIANLCNIAEVVERLIVTLQHDDVVNAGFFVDIRERIERNARAVSEGKKPPDWIIPTKSKLPPVDIPSAYLGGTAFAELFDKPLPFPLSQDIRFQHQFVVAPPGSGKTQLLQAQIAHDLTHVIAGKASIIVIDSQGINEGTQGKKRTLLQNLINLKLFAPGQPLDGKLVYLHPSRGLALNIFDMGQNDPSASERQREVSLSSAHEMISYCLSGDTDQQRQMIQYVVRLAMQMPDATIHTVRRILTTPEKRFEATFSEALDRATPLVQDYFRGTFFTAGRAPTKDAVLARVMGMLSSDIFADMFSHTHNSVRLLDEIEGGKVIVINTDKELLKRHACEAFGRFFIALLMQATMQRRTATPVFCYIDECHDYVAADENIVEMLLQARKQSAGLVLATQLLSNITSPKVRTALSSVAIKMAGRNTDEAPEIARFMGTNAEFISRQQVGTFAAYVQDITREGAITVEVPGFVMEKMERMTPEEHDQVHRLRAKSSPAPQPPTKKAEGWDDDLVH